MRPICHNGTVPTQLPAEETALDPRSFTWIRPTMPGRTKPSELRLRADSPTSPTGQTKSKLEKPLEQKQQNQDITMFDRTNSRNTKALDEPELYVEENWARIIFPIFMLKKAFIITNDTDVTLEVATQTSAPHKLNVAHKSVKHNFDNTATPMSSTTLETGGRHQRSRLPESDTVPGQSTSSERKITRTLS